MENESDTIEILIKKGSGKIPRGLEDRFDNAELFGMKVSVRELHTKAAIEQYVVAAMLLYFPWKIFQHTLTRLTDDIGDMIYDRLKESIRDFLRINGNACQLAVASKEVLPERYLEIRIHPRNLTDERFDGFLAALSGPITDLLDDLSYPAGRSLLVQIEWDMVTGNFGPITCFDVHALVLYEYNLAANRWQKPPPSGPDTP